MIEGSIFTHLLIKYIAQKYPPLEGPETGLYQMHSQQVRSLEVQADLSV